MAGWSDGDPVAPDRAGGGARTRREAGAGAPAGHGHGRGGSRQDAPGRGAARPAGRGGRPGHPGAPRRPPGRRGGRGDRWRGGDELARGAGAHHHRRADPRRARRVRPRARRRGRPGAAVLRRHRLVGAVLTTSRQPLGVAGERVVVLDPLGVPTAADPDPEAAPAVALFFELVTASDARWDRSERTVQAVAELCRAVDGLPLAIELAAARARTLSPTELLALVTQRTDTLRPPAGARRAGRRASTRPIALVGPAARRGPARGLPAARGPHGCLRPRARARRRRAGRRRPPPGGRAGGGTGRPVAGRRRADGVEHPVPDAAGRARARARRPDRRRPRRRDPGAAWRRRWSRRRPTSSWRAASGGAASSSRASSPAPPASSPRSSGASRTTRPRARLRPLRPAVCARPAEGRGRAGDRVRALRALAGDPRRPSARRRWP